MKQAVIAGTGLYAPQKIVLNEYFNDLYKKDVDTFLRSRRNIIKRHFMAQNETTSDMAVAAGRVAMQKAGIAAEDLDLIIIATDTPDYLSPSTASVVQHKLEASHAGTFDLNSACAGFVTALDVASKYIRSDEHYRYILVVGAYGMSKYLDWNDHKLATLFADGAGAVVIQSSDANGYGVRASKLYTEGVYHDYMGLYVGGTAQPATAESIAKGEQLLNFRKKIPLEMNPTHWPRLAQLVCDRAQSRVEDVSRFFLTQINIESIQQTMDQLNLPLDRAHLVMDQFAYTGSASIPMALADADMKGLLRDGDLIVLIGSGGGVSMGAMALRWGPVRG